MGIAGKVEGLCQSCKILSSRVKIQALRISQYKTGASSNGIKKGVPTLGEVRLWNTAQNTKSRNLWFPRRDWTNHQGKASKKTLSNTQTPTYKILNKGYNVVNSSLDIVSHGQR